MHRVSTATTFIEYNFVQNLIYDMTQPVVVTELFYYPVKACKGCAADFVLLDAKGIADDRRFMIVNERGRFLTQREHPRLALVEPALASGSATLRAPGMPALEVPFADEGATRQTRVWDDDVSVVSQGAEAARWLSEYLGEPCDLVRMAKNFSRRVDAKYAARPTDEVSFADAYPLLLLSEASLDDLNARLQAAGGAALPMNRFRPNLVVSGCAAFAEDAWKRVRIGNVVFRLVKPCARCAVTTINQETAEKGFEPLATLAAYRKSADGNKILFGQNLIHELPARGSARLGVGDAVEILE